MLRAADIHEIMDLLRNMLAACLLAGYGGAAGAAADGEDGSPVFTGEAEIEANYGHNYYGENRTVWDFPHVTVAGDLCLGRGWSVSAEFEYERFYEDGAWCVSFKDNFTTNRLYLNKAIGGGLNVKGGIVDVPVGLTNCGGPALTIYDPESESGVLPMSWHETGVALWGESGKWRYELSAISCLDFPLNRSCALGMAFRTDFSAVPGCLRVGASGYWGKSSCGMVRRCRAGDFVGTDGVFFGSADFCFGKNGWVAGGSVIYCTDNCSRSAGVEAGYDMAVPLGLDGKGIVLMPFVRYDGVFTDTARNKMTLGANIAPLRSLMLKVEYGCRRVCGLRTERTFDVGIGYSVGV